METVTGHVFHPDDLKPQQRMPGISGFMRIRNGEDFLEAAIRSHIDCFDEIVAVYNQCTDRTADILLALTAEYAPKIKVIHYADRVHPPGSADHARTPANSPNSLVNYYNFALAQTTRTIVTKLDDDHLAMGQQMRELCDQVRRLDDLDRVIPCFSGVNLLRDADGSFGFAANDLLCGNGDHWFFKVAPETFFEHDPRFEKLRLPGRTRRFAGFAYWHLKYLKAGSGFANYELDANPGNRYSRRLERIATSPVIEIGTARRRVAPTLANRLLAPFSDKQRLVKERAEAFGGFFHQATVEAALDEMTPQWRRWL